MGLFITPALAAHRQNKHRNQQQVEENNKLPEHVIHQVQRRQLRHHRPEIERQQRKADADNLPPPVAGQLRRHIKVAHRHAVFFQHLPAQAKHQPEQRQLLTIGPQQIADIQLHGQQNQANGQNHQHHRQRADQIDKNRFRRVKLSVIAQLPHL